MTKGLRSSMRTGLRVGWQKTGKPVVSQLARLPFRDEAANLISSLWQRGAPCHKGLVKHKSIWHWGREAHREMSADVLGLASCQPGPAPKSNRRQCHARSRIYCGHRLCVLLEQPHACEAYTSIAHGCTHRVLARGTRLLEG